MLQQPAGDDYVLATNVTTTVRDFVRMAFERAGMNVEFSVAGVEEVGRCAKTGKIVVRVDPKYFRPTEVDWLLGNPAKAKRVLGWEPKVAVRELCREMTQADLYRAKQEQARAVGGQHEAEELAHTPGGFLAWFEKNVRKYFGAWWLGCGGVGGLGGVGEDCWNAEWSA